MARPSIKDGWFKMSHELDAAIAYAGFNRAESVVLRHVRKEIFFPSLKKIAVLSPSAISHRTTIHRVSVSKAIASLTDSGVLEKVDGGYRFVKDYERWTWQGNPRFTSEEVQLFKSEGKNPMNAKAENDCSGFATGGVADSLQGCSGFATGGVADSLQGCSGFATGGVADSLQSRARALEERAELDLIQREEDKYKKEKQEKEKPSSPDPKTESEWTPGVDPMAPNVLTPEQSAEMRRALNLCDELFPMLEDVKRVISERQGKFPPEWYSAALRAMSLRPSKTWRCHYLLGILKNYVVIGGPDSTDTQNTPPNQTAGIPRKPDGRESVGQKIDRIQEERIRSIAAQAEKLKARYSE